MFGIGPEPPLLLTFAQNDQNRHFCPSSRNLRMTTFDHFCHFCPECLPRQGGPGQNIKVRLGGPGSLAWSQSSGPPRYKPRINSAEGLLLQRLYAPLHLLFWTSQAIPQRRIYNSVWKTRLWSGDRPGSTLRTQRAVYTAGTSVRSVLVWQCRQGSIGQGSTPG